jgi:flagellar hook-basal body complex protein FliE
MQLGIESITAVASMQAGLPAAGPMQLDTAQHASAPDGFVQMMQTKLDDMNTNVTAAETALSNLATGKAVEPQEAMISMERARISVMTFIQLRNKLVESYQDVMRMQL